MMMKVDPSSYSHTSIEICPNRKLFDFEIADNVVLLSKDPSKLQAFLYRLSDTDVVWNVLHLRSARCLFGTGLAVARRSFLQRKLLELNRFIYLSIYISSDGRTSGVVSEEIQKAHLVFTNLRHMWGHRHIQFLIEGRIDTAAVSLVLL